jgi:hypothetical protein
MSTCLVKTATEGIHQVESMQSRVLLKVSQLFSHLLPTAHLQLERSFWAFQSLVQLTSSGRASESQQVCTAYATIYFCHTAHA